MKKTVLSILLIVVLAMLGIALIWFFFYEAPAKDPKAEVSRIVVYEETVKERNNIYEVFFGENLTASDVRSLIVRLKIDNMEDEAKAFGEIKWIGITDTKELKSKKQYTIRAVDYYENGSLKTIEIIEQ